MKIVEYDVEQGSPEWHALREPLYTGSNADRLLRFGQIDYSKGSGSFGGNFWTKRGHILEDRAIVLYERITGEQVRRVGFVKNLAYPSCGYSPDGLLPTILIEVKCFKEDKHLAMWNGDIPFKVLAQIHYGMFITGRKVAHLVIYNPEFMKRIPAEPEKAFKIITIRRQAAIAANFKRILTPKESTNAFHTQAA